jgi:hypothetical protein
MAWIVPCSHRRFQGEEQVNKTTEALKLAEVARTPLKDLLRAVPKDGSDWYEEDKFCHHNIPYGRLIHEALAEIERLEALAEPVKQEPVAWMYQFNYEGSLETAVTVDFEMTQLHKGKNIRPLYAAPVSVPKQEPVAFVKENPFCPEGRSDELTIYLPVGTALYAAPVSAKYEWVDLTDDEIHEALHGKDAPVGLLNGIRNVIADFKEKNK